jgi:hypothetical protein
MPYLKPVPELVELYGLIMHNDCLKDHHWGKLGEGDIKFTVLFLQFLVSLKLF